MPEGEIGGPYGSLHDDKVAKQKVIDFITIVYCTKKAGVESDPEI